MIYHKNLKEFKRLPNKEYRSREYLTHLESGTKLWSKPCQELCFGTVNVPSWAASI